MELISQYSAWYYLLCFGAALLYSSIVYYKNKKTIELSSWLRIVLFCFRTIVVFFIALLILSPFFKSVNTEIEKPILLIGLDNSSSIANNGEDYCKDLNKKIIHLQNQFSDVYEVKTFSFGEKVQPYKSNLFSEKSTDLSSFFDEMETQYSNKNVGAIVLMTDGVYNTGVNPVYQEKLKQVPVYSVVLGDTITYKDLFVKDLYFNNITFLGNKFPLEILIDATKCEKEKTTLIVEMDGVVKYTEEILLNKTPISKKVLISADQVGMRKLVVQLKKVEGEKIIVNNRREVFVEVLDGRQKVLLLSKGPHPDLGALKMAIESNENYKAEIAFFDSFKGKINQYSMVAIHRFPDESSVAEPLMKEIFQSKVGICLVLGTQMSYSHLARYNFGIQWPNLAGNNRSYNDCYPAFNKDFVRFSLSPGTADFFKDVTPLKSPFISFQVPGDAEHLFYQKIGSVETDAPLMTFYSMQESKICLIAGEGIWRWKLNDFMKNENDNHFKELIQKTVQYLSVKEDKSNFRINHQKKFMENEEVLFNAEVYNDSYELSNLEELKLKLKNNKGKEFEFVFDKISDRYRLNMGCLEAGNYSYVASTKIANKKLEKTGKFIVEEMQLENISHRSDVFLLSKIADNTGGKVFHISQLDQMVAGIKAREDIKPVEHSAVEMKELIHEKWLFVLLILLLSVEWVLRKRYGLN